MTSSGSDQHLPYSMIWHICHSEWCEGRRSTQRSQSCPCFYYPYHSILLLLSSNETYVFLNEIHTWIRRNIPIRFKTFLIQYSSFILSADHSYSFSVLQIIWGASVLIFILSLACPIGTLFRGTTTNNTLQILPSAFPLKKKKKRVSLPNLWS